MNARITPRRMPHRTDLYAGVLAILSDGDTLWLATRHGYYWLALGSVAEITLDDDPGGWWF